MNEQQYTHLYERIGALETTLRGSRAAAWMRADVRQDLIARVGELRDALYRVKIAEDAEGRRRDVLRDRLECPTCE